MTDMGKASADVSIHEVRCGEADYRMVLPWSRTDSIQRHIASTGTPYEGVMIQDVIERCERGDLVIDVGANIGNHSLAWGANGLQVLAFEPHPELAEALEQSIELNGLENSVLVFEKALSDHQGDAHLIGMTDANMGTGHLEEGGDAGPTVQVGCLRDPGRPVAVIKVDTEGSELAVLRGALPVIERHHPLLYIECLDQASYEDVSGLLRPLGYRYEETFNASPTHRFAWCGELSGDDRSVHALMRRYYEAYGNWGRVRQQLQDANAKYRTATTSFAQLQTQMRDQQSRHEQELREAHQNKPASAKEVVEAHQNLADAMGVIQTLEQRLLGQKRLAEEWSAELDRLTGRYSEAQQSIQELQLQLNELKAQKDGLLDRLAGRDRELDDLKTAAQDREGQHNAAVRQLDLQLQTLTQALEETHARLETAVLDHARVKDSLLDELALKALRLAEARERDEIQEIVASLANETGQYSVSNPDQVTLPAEDLRYLRQWIAGRQDAEREQRRDFEARAQDLEERQLGLSAEVRSLTQSLLETRKRAEIANGRADRLRAEAQGLHEERRVHRARQRSLEAEVASLQKELVAARQHADTNAALRRHLAETRRSAEAMERAKHLVEEKAAQDVAQAAADAERAKILVEEQAAEAAEKARVVMEKQIATIGRLETQKRQLRYEITQLRHSRTMAVGREFGSTRGPVSIVTLPWRLYTVARKPKSPAPKEIEK